MSKIPLILVSTGIFLSFFNLRLGPVVWASAPVVVYVLVSVVYRRHLGWWSGVGILSALMAVLSYFLKIGG